MSACPLGSPTLAEIRPPRLVLDVHQLHLDSLSDQSEALRCVRVSTCVVDEAHNRRQHKSAYHDVLHILRLYVVISRTEPLAFLIAEVIEKQIAPRPMHRMRSHPLNDQVEPVLEVEVPADGGEVRQPVGSAAPRFRPFRPAQCNYESNQASDFR